MTQPNLIAASEGRIVHVHTPGVTHCQPAVVVNAWGSGLSTLNLVVFRDGSNDAAIPGVEEPGALTSWATSVPYSDERNSGTRTWHWPERV